MTFSDPFETIGRHLDHTTEGIADRLGRIEARLDRIDAKLDVDPTPPPPRPTLRDLNQNEVIFQVDASNPGTFAPSRPFGQAWAAGNMFQLRSGTDHVHPLIQGEDPQRGAGYGLRMTADGSVESWPMEDGERLRYGRIVDNAGRPWLRMSTQFRLDDGYDPAANRFIRGWRIQTAVNRAAGRSDPVTFDGSRCGLSGIGANLSVGPGSKSIVWGLEIRTHPCMFTRTSFAGPFDLHAPGWRLTGPVLGAITGGRMRFWSKHSPTADPLDFDTVRQSDLVNLELGAIELPEPGRTLAIVIETLVDRTGSDNRFAVWQVNPDGTLTGLLEFDQPYGYSFRDPVKNGGFYPIGQLYQWHEHNHPSSSAVRSGRGALWNHDPVNGNVHRMDVRSFAVSQTVTAERMGEAIASRFGR